MRHAAFLTGPDQLLYEFHMHFAEAAAVMTFLMQNSDEIDCGNSPRQEPGQGHFIVHIGGDYLDTGED